MTTAAVLMKITRMKKIIRSDYNCIKNTNSEVDTNG